MKSKHGSVVIYTLMIGLVIFVIALALAPIVKNLTDTARNETSGDTVGLDCSNESISNFDKAACVATDLTQFYYIGALIFIGGIIITAKVVFG